MEGKKIYLSKLIWTGIITMVYGVLKYFGFDAELTPGAIEIILGILIVVFRKVTNKPVEWQKK
jgi:hypothetical protein